MYNVSIAPLSVHVTFSEDPPVCYDTSQATSGLVLIYVVHYQDLPWSEFVVANTLGKWKKLEPNEIDFSHGFSQKIVSTCCSVFNQRLLSSVDNL